MTASVVPMVSMSAMNFKNCMVGVFCVTMVNNKRTDNKQGKHTVGGKGKSGMGGRDLV